MLMVRPVWMPVFSAFGIDGRFLQELSFAVDVAVPLGDLFVDRLTPLFLVSVECCRLDEEQSTMLSCRRGIGRLPCRPIVSSVMFVFGESASRLQWLIESHRLSVCCFMVIVISLLWLFWRLKSKRNPTDQLLGLSAICDAKQNNSLKHSFGVIVQYRTGHRSKSQSVFRSGL